MPCSPSHAGQIGWFFFFFPIHDERHGLESSEPIFCVHLGLLLLQRHFPCEQGNSLIAVEDSSSFMCLKTEQGLNSSLCS